MFGNDYISVPVDNLELGGRVKIYQLDSHVFLYLEVGFGHNIVFSFISSFDPPSPELASQGLQNTLKASHLKLRNQEQYILEIKQTNENKHSPLNNLGFWVAIIKSTLKII